MRTEERPVAGTDEIRSSAGSEQFGVRIRSAADRDTRQTDGTASGDRGDETCLKLRKSLPAGCRKRAAVHTDYRESHTDTLPPERHRAAGKESGGTAHTERFSNTLRQMCPVTVRKTLSFSENAEMHGKRVGIFAESYDKRLSV